MRKAAMTRAMILLLFVAPAAGHGRLIEPPSRASAWRFGFNTPVNYNDNELSCGGLSHQWSNQQGRCGICGDPWDSNPRPHEAGGLYATGTIVRTYTQGQTIQAVVEITANHLGWFEFRLCSVTDPAVEATHDCLSTHLLRLARNGKTRLDIGRRNGNYVIDIVLPSGLTCNHCVFQWKYHAGNSWGTDPDGTGCLGCGEAQEEFYGCADVAVVSNNSALSPPPTPAPEAHCQTTAVRRTTAAATTGAESNPQRQGQRSRCRAVGVWRSVTGMNSWCVNNCRAGYCPPSHCNCT